MENRLLVLTRLFAAAPGFVVRHRILILTLVVLISVIQAVGVATRTRIDISTDSMIDQSDPAIAALNAFRTQFGSDDSLFLVYEARDGDIFSARSLAAARELTESLHDWRTLDASAYAADLQELDQIRRVQSLTTLRVQRVDGDTLRSERLVPDVIPDDPAKLADIRARALAEDDYLLAFYSADGRFGALLIQTTFGARPLDDYEPAVNAADISLDDAFSNFGGDGSTRTPNTVGAVQPMSNAGSTNGYAAVEDNRPGEWGNALWSAAPMPSGHARLGEIRGRLAPDVGTLFDGWSEKDVTRLIKALGRLAQWFEANRL
jgi:hypothetical protein